ncbi:MAG: helix-turn-helix domain-containing protein [Janthinobacterium lividum]
MTPPHPQDPLTEDHRIVCHLDGLLTERNMTLTELSARVGVTVVNLSVLKNDRARAVGFSTLTAICRVLRCQPGDVFSVTAQRRGRPGSDLLPSENSAPLRVT